MTTRRLLATGAGMAAVALVLGWLTPSVPELAETLRHGQRTVDEAGAEALLLAAVGLLAWGLWSWGALGLLLTALSALPGALGAAADVLTRAVLPAGARRAAALALGLGLGVTAPVAGAVLIAPTAAVAAGPGTSVPDWPAPAGPHGGAVPDWPVEDTTGQHVVVRGECLWDIAAAHLTARLGRTPTAAEIAGAVPAWWSTNAAVIGPDPDLLLPGQVLRPPA
ncbi:LysM domain-containing protein [Blastococcus sp. CCUG 61487]|uniref:LysM peptidoglycan-binding domain-containing protein n=1 Tax=Blastococcus sp. CCUG 61487 TaxID=1840703 RepID=UPI0010BF9DCD|nr:LysM domain-containing protein [Blastococcus sp. CCUG 61487]TKJ32089.1 hypothetical protein A6V29_17415 [Blastococcus sp. CCUG 61487]